MSGLNVTATRCEALFVSELQHSQRPSAEQVRSAILRAIRENGTHNCVAQVAQEFGDHPDTAVVRMRWAREAVAVAYSVRTRGWSTRTTPRRMAATALPPARAA